jgi:hypothetical protein
MKIFNKKLIYILGASIVLLACKKDPDVEMVSLNKLGEEHHFGEKVLMWASTEGEKEGMSYSWTATGGSFEGFRTQNLFENVWIAPTQVGTYEVTATAKNGKSTSSRTTTINVTRYFFDHFQSPNIFAGNGWPGWGRTQATTNQLNTGDKNLSNIEIRPARVNTSNTDTRITKQLDFANLTPPFSIRTKIGYKEHFKPTAPFTIHLYFRQPRANLNRPYLREIRWEIFPTPTGTGNQYQLRYEIFNPSTNTATLSTTNSGAYPSALPLINPVSGRNTALFTFTPGVAKNITFSIDANKVFSAHIDGIEWFTSNGLKDWFDAAKAQWPDFADPIGREFRIAMPGRASATAPVSVLFLNSVYINNDGTILNTP